MSKDLSILYVDDEETNVYVFDMQFRKRYRVYKAFSGAEGLEILRNNPDISVVLTDMKMPVMDGLTFASKIREEFEHIKVMMLSAFMKSKVVEEAMQQGLLLEYFRKPLKIDTFVQKVESLNL